MHRSNTLIFILSSALLGLALGGCAESSSDMTTVRHGGGASGGGGFGQARLAPPYNPSPIPVTSGKGSTDPHLSIGSIHSGGIGVR